MLLTLRWAHVAATAALVCALMPCRAQGPPEKEPLPDPAAAISKVAAALGIADGVRAEPSKVWSDSAWKRESRARFLEKSGYQYNDLVRFLKTIEAEHPCLQIDSIDLGRRDQNPSPDLSTSMWRPRSVVVRALAEATPDFRPPSALDCLRIYTDSILSHADSLEARLSIWELNVTEWKLTATMRSASIENMAPLLRTILDDTRVARVESYLSKGNMATVVVTFKHPVPPTAAAVNASKLPEVLDAMKERAVPGKLEFRAWAISGSMVHVRLTFAEYGDLTRFVKEAEAEPRVDGFILDDLQAEESGRRLLCEGRLICHQ